jgi:uncharacterized protein with von Willebrand factor type A (vWA) domain
MSHLIHNVIVFGRLLRRLGLDVHTGRLLDVAEALPLVDLGRREDVYHTCRALLVHRHEELAAFDRAFDAFWRLLRARESSAGHPSEPGHEGARPAEPPEGGPSETGLEAGEDALDAGMRTWSDAGALAERDFATFTDEELLVARAALDRLSWNPGERRTRRWVPGRGPRLDLRRALAHSPRTGGDVVKLPRRHRRLRPRPLVIVCDVSGSMERYSRMLLHFAHAIGQQHRRVEAFLYSIRLTRITPELRTRRLDEAITAVAKSVRDWSGGTRTGDALRELNQRWSRRVLHGGPVVLLISDGWDRGDPAELGEQVARLQRSCHRLIWLNPLIGTADYAPLTRGLQASLPFVDDFLPARTLNDLADLAGHLNRLTPHG